MRTGRKKKRSRSRRVVDVVMTCPEHGVPWINSPTRYGIRCSCPIDGCSYVYWPEQPTSTPATQEMRTARMEAHKAFDAVWKSGLISRNQCYKRLRDHLGLTSKQTHIGMFGVEQANATRDFAIAFRAELETQQEQ